MMMQRLQPNSSEASGTGCVMCPPLCIKSTNRADVARDSTSQLHGMLLGPWFRGSYSFFLFFGSFSQPQDTS
jgi:hypothetical protein